MVWNIVRIIVGIIAARSGLHPCSDSHPKTMSCGPRGENSPSHHGIIRSNIKSDHFSHCKECPQLPQLFHKPPLPCQALLSSGCSLPTPQPHPLGLRKFLEHPSPFQGFLSQKLIMTHLQINSMTSPEESWSKVDKYDLKAKTFIFTTLVCSVAVSRECFVTPEEETSAPQFPL